MNSLYLMFGFAVLGLHASPAHARSSETLRGQGNPVLQNASPQLSDEDQRKKLLAEARSKKDIEGVLAYAEPGELGPIVDELYGKHASGEAHELSSGTNLTGFAARIDATISSKPQKLVMSFKNPDGSGTTIVAPVSAGTGIRSDLLKNHCFTIQKSDGAAAMTVHGDTLVEPIFFRGKRGPGNSELPDTNTYAIHGLLGPNYEKLLGQPASHGCLRVSRADAKKLRKAVNQVGASNVVICVK